MKTFITTLLIVISFGVVAQKQPQIQEISVWVPANVKIDGKLKEWPNPCQNDHNTDAYLSAYNATNRFYYTIANDDNTLYLTLRGLGTAAAQKALNGGIAFTINRMAEKKIKTNAAGNIVITFPLSQDEKTVNDIMGPIFSLNNYLPDTVNKRRQIDSLIALASKRSADGLKELGITGITEIKDSVISIYNENSIKAAFGFIKRQPVIEIAIPLKYLGLSAGGVTKFAYNIKLAGPKPATVEEIGINTDKDTGMGVNINAMYNFSSSDFGGVYILAKK